jgi:hypothetical protein
VSRYIPVAAKRHALMVYRDRRRGGGRPGLPETAHSPAEAIESTVEFFAGHLAVWVALYPSRQGSRERIRVLTDGYRAAHYYRQQMRRKQWRNYLPVLTFSQLRSPR